jgi:hypothetical protein
MPPSRDTRLGVGRAEEDVAPGLGPLPGRHRGNRGELSGSPLNRSAVASGRES